jgi:hypothetical protein
MHCVVSQARCTADAALLLQDRLKTVCMAAEDILPLKTPLYQQIAVKRLKLAADGNSCLIEWPALLLSIFILLCICRLDVLIPYFIVGQNFAVRLNSDDSACLCLYTVMPQGIDATRHFWINACA